jgi:hypothetical protein
MKIIKQTGSELVLQNSPSLGLSTFIMIWAAIFMGIPLLGIVGIFASLGVTSLSCQRVESNQINCERQQSTYFGFVQTPPMQFRQVTTANFESQEGRDSEDNRTIEYFVTLSTHSGKARAIEDLIYVNSVKGSASEMQAIATQINRFIQSNQPTLRVLRDLRWNWGQSLFSLAFMSLFLLIGGGVLFFVFQWETLTFNRDAGNLVWQRHTLLGKKQETHLLSAIRAIQIEKKTDSDGDVSYVLKLLPESVHKDSLMSSSQLPEVEQISKMIRAFLHLS